MRLNKLYIWYLLTFTVVSFFNCRAGHNEKDIRQNEIVVMKRLDNDFVTYLDSLSPAEIAPLPIKKKINELIQEEERYKLTQVLDLCHFK